ncbi:S-adenosyl-L-methionine-dependent methyltransferase [Roridomyces roridus]|uniref:S-adenosyl-L-methionine-dependent methyltransferase n=1 Tax=Roridomyces roridus TaxID=1738132 RepID=A0AAD7FIQ9_9AGAR|nr:S-adenosyl-L-methionine-dependent methyltransferase [Roridomyces roridus]
MTSAVHPRSLVGFGKGTNELYNKARPSYRPEVLSRIRKAVESPGPLNVVEIGSGTGLFTRALLEQWTDVGSLKAIEPSEGMRETFAKYTTDDRITLTEGTFDNTGVEDGWADVVVIAQAYHWCLDHGAAAAEFGRILKPGGVLSLIWNAENDDAVEWLKQLQMRAKQEYDGTPNFRSGLWRGLFEASEYLNLFLPPEEQIFQWDIPGTTEGILNRALSSSRVIALADAERDQFVEDVRVILERGDGRKWIEEDKGTFVYPHTTRLVLSRRK